MATQPGRARRWLLVATLALGPVAVGCAKSDSTGRAQGQGGTAGAAPSAGTAATGQTAGMSGSGTVSGGALNIGGLAGSGAGAGGTTSVSPEDACAKSTDTATPLPSILQLVVDTSGSMDWPPGWRPTSPNDSKPPGATKWEITRDALLAAVQALPAEVALGVNFYPNVQQEGTTCLLNRVAVPIGPLGAAGSKTRATWQAAAAGVDPVGATPTHGAYRFGLTQLVATPLSGAKFILLITDGTPTCTIDCLCNEGDLPVDPAPLLEEAATALSDDIRTFVIGSPGSEATRDVLSQLAVVGQTARAGCSPAGPNYCHFDMTTQKDLASGLAEALDEIAVSLRSCEYPIPPPPAGEKLDTSRVNVLYTPPGGASETIGRDPTQGECREGWQFSADGKNVVLCGRACDQVRTDETGVVEILFGCETVTAEPK